MSVLPNGVYVGLDEEHYFAQDRLGSTDLVILHKDPADYWYRSKHNPNREERERTEELDFGKALHIAILEGDEAYDERVAVSPYPDFRTKDAKAWREAQQIEGRVVLSRENHRRVLQMAALILNHPQYAGPLRQGMPEVSVLFDWNGIPVRARFDYLLPRFVIDLKSYGGHVRGRDPKDKALIIVANNHYDVQRFLYDRAREAMIELVNAGAVFGASDEQLAWLQRLVKEQDWTWTWIFYQRQDDRNGKAPVVQPIARPRFDITMDTGKRKAEAAVANYRRYMDRFGVEVPWALIEQLWTPPDVAFPSWLGDVSQPEDQSEAA